MDVSVLLGVTLGCFFTVLVIVTVVIIVILLVKKKRAICNKILASPIVVTAESTSKLATSTDRICPKPAGDANAEIKTASSNVEVAGDITSFLDQSEPSSPLKDKKVFKYHIRGSHVTIASEEIEECTDEHTRDSYVTTAPKEVDENIDYHARDSYVTTVPEEVDESIDDHIKVLYVITPPEKVEESIDDIHNTLTVKNTSPTEQMQSESTNDIEIETEIKTIPKKDPGDLKKILWSYKGKKRRESKNHEYFEEILQQYKELKEDDSNDNKDIDHFEEILQQYKEAKEEDSKDDFFEENLQQCNSSISPIHDAFTNEVLEGEVGYSMESVTEL